MKIKLLISLLLSSAIFISCKRDKTERFEMADYKVTKVELLADHTQLIADGKSILSFNPQVYSTYSYKDPSGVDTDVDALIKADRVRPGSVKYFMEDGTSIEGVGYTTSDLSKPELKFYAIADGIKSALLTIKIRAPFADSQYQVIEYPVVFHVIQNKNTVDMKQGVGSDVINYAIEQINRTFARQVVFSPNGADTKIRFRMAEYNPQGKQMAEKGINRYSLSPEELSLLKEANLLTNPDICWDYKKYLNIWIIDTWSNNAKPPKYILQPADLNKIKGFTFTKADEPTINAAAYAMTDIGLVYQARAFGVEDVYYSAQIGKFFGLIETKSKKEDYCDDTFVYTNFYSNTNLGNSRLKKTLEGMPFLSVNIMDDATYQNTISMDQVSRMRMVTEYCPHRWAYKSNWAFTKH
ncbi:hypothetical protein FBD94_02440 [Pedobacter hiemivivus]|uniref:Uncharacterized protein n=1 Tax=Pedobacter hiemivivus TaxID=2530454 RepID=A0A4U1GM13_9SPHI|nr:hypothetical protein [Pedobacter hiemivivus]TKC65431.1 hypothetical protein FBD94_02440 [Pedobacter hiemivivus]